MPELNWGFYSPGTQWVENKGLLLRLQHALGYYRLHVQTSPDEHYDV
jgi:hypothetical protein